MLVKCIKNQIRDVTNDPKLSEELNHAFGGENNGQLPLELGRNYVVYGVSVIKRYPWYNLCAEKGILYPWLYPAPLFEIVDNRLSSCWVFGYSVRHTEGGMVGTVYTQLNFDEWISEDYFVDKLLDGNARELSVFKKYKELMDMEFSDPSISKEASLLEADWVMCPVCDEAWETAGTNEMLRCPKCKTVLLNPFQKKKKSTK